ncbi:MAG: hypothetical protein ACKVGZ_02070 [Alphaproteobacteria bacterium]
MKIATFAALAVVTAAVIGGAYFATQERESGLAETFQATSLYPDLLGRVNDVTYLRIASQADGPLTMEKQGDLWWSSPVWKPSSPKPKSLRTMPIWRLSRWRPLKGSSPIPST